MTTLGAPAHTPLGRRLHDRLVEHLGRQIVDGVIPCGQQLPAEKHLSDALFVSHTVTRHALLLLEAKGLVTTRHGAGTRVRPRAQWNLLDRDVLRWILAGDGQRGPHAAPLDAGAVRTALDELVSVLHAHDAQLRANPVYDALMRILSDCDAPDPTTIPKDDTP